jgi:hypothetical protein
MWVEETTIGKSLRVTAFDSRRSNLYFAEYGPLRASRARACSVSVGLPPFDSKDFLEEGRDVSCLPFQRIEEGSRPEALLDLPPSGLDVGFDLASADDWAFRCHTQQCIIPAVDGLTRGGETAAIPTRRDSPGLTARPARIVLLGLRLYGRFTWMGECLTESDLQELGRTALEDFERRLVSLPEDLCAPFHDEARQLETELLFLYRATVLCVRREPDIDKVGARWAEMVRLCRDFLTKLKKLGDQHPGCGAGIYYDRVLDLRAKCERLREMHQ